MNEPQTDDQIPEDVMEAARALVASEQVLFASAYGTVITNDRTVEAIARVILAERTRCAQIVRNHEVSKWRDPEVAESVRDELIEQIEGA